MNIIQGLMTNINKNQKTPTHKVGEKIKKARQEQGLTATKLAQQMGYDPSLINKIENGKSSIDVEKLVAFSRILNRDVVYFLQDFQR